MLNKVKPDVQGIAIVFLRRRTSVHTVLLSVLRTAATAPPLINSIGRNCDQALHSIATNRRGLSYGPDELSQSL